MIPSASDMRRVVEGQKVRQYNPAFDYILGKASKTVKDAARQKHSSVAYIIPDYVQGYPIYTSEACAAYVTNVFENKGYSVSLVGEQTLVIRWEAEPVPFGVPRAPVVHHQDDDKFSKLTL